MTQEKNVKHEKNAIESFHDCVIAEYRSIEKANLALEVLATGGFTTETVSRISFGQPSSDNVLPDERLSAQELSIHSKRDGSSAGETGQLRGEIPDQLRGNPDKQKADKAAGIGALIGGAVATPLSIGTLVGPFFVVGPLLGLGAGAAVGGLFGAAERWGVRRDVAADYEQRIRNGSVLVIVANDSSLRLHEAYKLLQTSGPFSLERFRAPATPER